MTNPIHNSTTASGFGALRRLFINTTSLLTSDVINRAAVFAVYIMVGRFCGARSFGQLSLGLTLLYTFQVFASVGLPTLITREVAKRPALAGRYLANGSLIVVGAFLVSLAALAGLVAISGYQADTSKVVLLLGLAILPWSLTTITESLLRAWERMHFLLLIHGPVNVIKVFGIYYLLSSGYDVPTVAVVLLLCQFATLLLELTVVARHINWTEVALSLSFCRATMGRAWRFMGIDSLLALSGSISTVLVSWLVGETAVGIIGAAWQLLTPVRLANQSIANSLFPLLSRRAEESRTQFQRLTALVLDVLLFLSVPSSLLLFFGALPVITFVYGNQDFANSVLVMRILLPVLIFQAITAALGQVLFSHRCEHRTLVIVVIDVVFGVVAGAVMISAFGVVGAALAQTLTGLLDACLHVVATRDCLVDESGRRFRWRDTLIPHVAVAGSAMAAVMAVMIQFGLVGASVAASLLYLLVLGTLIYATGRNGQSIDERFIAPLREHRDSAFVYRDAHLEDSLCPETVAT